MRILGGTPCYYLNKKLEVEQLLFHMYKPATPPAAPALLFCGHYITYVD